MARGDAFDLMGRITSQMVNEFSQPYSFRVFFNLSATQLGGDCAISLRSLSTSTSYFSTAVLAQTARSSNGYSAEEDSTTSVLVAAVACSNAPAASNS